MILVNRKRGFTLIEMLGILVVLSIIVMISVPSITSMLKQANQQKYDEWLQSLYIASEQYVEGHRAEFYEANNGGTSYLSIELLLKKGYLKNSIKEPKTGQDVTKVGLVEVKPNSENILTYQFRLKEKLDSITLKVDMSPSLAEERWTASDVVLTANATATLGIRVDQYSFDGGVSWQSSNKKTVTKNGKVQVLARDSRLDQRSNVVEANVKHIDKTVPDRALASINLVSTKSITVNAICEDEQSGIRGYRYSKDGGAHWTDEMTGVSGKSYKFDGLATGKYPFKVKCINQAGLEKESESVEQTTSELPIPTCTITPSSGWTRAKIVMLDFGTLPEENGISYQYQIYQGSVKDGTTPLTNKSWLISNTKTKELIVEPISGMDHASILLKVTDGVNTKAGSTCMITNLDIDSPTCTINVDSSTDSSVNLSVEVKDPAGRIAKDGYSWFNEYDFGTEKTKKVTENGTYHVWVKDQAGNIGTCSTKITELP